MWTRCLRLRVPWTRSRSFRRHLAPGFLKGSLAISLFFELPFEATLVASRLWCRTMWWMMLLFANDLRRAHRTEPNVRALPECQVFLPIFDALTDPIFHLWLCHLLESCIELTLVIFRNIALHHACDKVEKHIRFRTIVIQTSSLSPVSTLKTTRPSVRANTEFMKPIPVTTGFGMPSSPTTCKPVACPSETPPLRGSCNK